MLDEVVLPYSRLWPELFQRERDCLVEVIGEWLVCDVEQVCSTSVPGMAAKPVIDMIAGVSDLGAARGAFDRLRVLGYHYRPHRPEALLFEKPHIGTWRGQTHHLHLTDPDPTPISGASGWCSGMLCGLTRLDSQLVEEYSQWKRRHASDAGPVPYSGSKLPFVSRVLAARGIDVKPDAQRLSPQAQAGPVWAHAFTRRSVSMARRGHPMSTT